MSLRGTIDQGSRVEVVPGHDQDPDPVHPDDGDVDPQGVIPDPGTSKDCKNQPLFSVFLLFRAIVLLIHNSY